MADYEKPMMPAALREFVSQTVDCELSDGELDSIEDAYRLFTFHVLPSYRDRCRKITLKYTCGPFDGADYVFNMIKVRLSDTQDDADNPIFKAVITVLSEKMAGLSGSEAVFSNARMNWMRKDILDSIINSVDEN